MDRRLAPAVLSICALFVLGIVAGTPVARADSVSYTLSACETFTSEGPKPPGPCHFVLQANLSLNEDACTTNVDVTDIHLQIRDPNSILIASTSNAPGQLCATLVNIPLVQAGTYKITADFSDAFGLLLGHTDGEAIVSTSQAVPEFPFGLFAIFGLAVPVLIIVRARYPARIFP